MISKRWKIGKFYTKWFACHAMPSAKAAAADAIGLPALQVAALPGRLVTACLPGFHSVTCHRMVASHVTGCVVNHQRTFSAQHNKATHTEGLQQSSRHTAMMTHTRR